MKKIATGFSPLISISRKNAKPLQRQIYDAFRDAIVRGGLSANQQIPSSRALASELGVSRIPILNAYAQLLAEGYFDTLVGSGTFVSSSFQNRQKSNRSGLRQHEYGKMSGPRPVSRRSKRIPLFKPNPWFFGLGAFSPGQSAFEYFPRRIWTNLVSRHWRNITAESLHFSDPRGSLEFRETIATYLRAVRGVNCDAEQILVVSGSQQALEISARVLLDAGSQVWIEEPGYRLTRNVLHLAGCESIPVPVDDEGLNISAGIQKCRSARAAFVTPSHQYPLGVTMSASRRLQLLDWAQSAGAWIVEDDYDSEYRYKNMPIASLQGLDRHSRVIYVGTFSKTLFPSLRLGYVVVPRDLIDRFLAVRQTMDIYPAHQYQAILTEFIRQGHYSRHIRRTQTIYSERRAKLVEALHGEFGSRLPVLGAEAGLHLAVTLPKSMRDEEIAYKAARDKLWLWPLSQSYLGKDVRQGFVLGFGSTPVESIPGAVRKLRSILPAV